MSSSRPDPAVIPPALLHPEATADKRVRQYNDALRLRGPRPRLTERTIPGLDVAALARRYGGGANSKQTMTGVFRVPVGATWEQYRRVRDASLARYLKVLEAKGYRLIPRKGSVRVAPGVYPAQHPGTGAKLLDQREFRVSVDCTYPRAEAVVIRLEPEDVGPIVQRKEK